MTNSPYEKAEMARHMLELVPRLIRKSLLNDKSFREEFGLKTQTMTNFGNSGPTFPRSEFFDAVQKVLTGSTQAELIDAEREIWVMTRDARASASNNFALSSGQQRLLLPDFSVLSKDVSVRLRSFEKYASDVNLPLGAREEWQLILEARALEDDEVSNFYSDIQDTPAHVERHIRSEITCGECSISSLVPNTRRYFERLVGAYDGSGSIRDYAIDAGRGVFKQLTECSHQEGFLFSLFLSSHPALTDEINIDRFTKTELETAFDYLEKHGDVLSRLGALEVGLRILPSRPEVEPYLLALVHRIRDDDVKGKVSHFKLFSALFVLVDGELARTRLLNEEPPFYRRLASLAQAALIHRQLVQCRIDYDHFCKLMFSSRGEHFYMQTLVDMRTEPRWQPDMVVADQFQANFLGRILIAGQKFQANLGDGELRDTILGGGEKSLIKLCECPRLYFPGPLDGAEDSSNVLPDNIARIIEEQLDSDEVAATSFIALINAAMIFRIASGHAELAAKALRKGCYRLSNLEDKSQLVAILNGLARVAALSRNPALADELRILMRRYRHDAQYGLSVEDALQIALVASAARGNLMEWRDFVGNCLTELAFDDLEGNEGKVLHSHLSALLHSVPELWVSCAKAEAALKAWCLR